MTQKAIDELPVKFEKDASGESFGKISKKVSPEEKKEKEEAAKKAVSVPPSYTVSDRREGAWRRERGREAEGSTRR